MKLEAELWAQSGVDNLCAPYRDREPDNVDLVEALALIRAAYAQGYSSALADPAALPLAEAAARTTTLRLMLP